MPRSSGNFGAHVARARTQPRMACATGKALKWQERMPRSRGNFGAPCGACVHAAAHGSFPSAQTASLYRNRALSSSAHARPVKCSGGRSQCRVPAGILVPRMARACTLPRMTPPPARLMAGLSQSRAQLVGACTTGKARDGRCECRISAGTCSPGIARAGAAPRLASASSTPTASP